MSELGEKVPEDFDWFFQQALRSDAGFDLMTRDLVFTILVEVFMNHILAKNTYFTNHIEWTEHKIVIVKPANKYQIVWQCHNFKNILISDFHHYQFLYQTKLL